MKICLFACFTALFLAGCATGPRFHPREKPEATFSELQLTNRLDSALLQPPTEPYRLGPGDMIEIEVIGDGAAIPVALLVGPDGKIYYSLLPGLSVWGLTVTETRKLIESELAKFARVNPTTVINVRTVGSRRVWMLGSVAAPGVYPLATPVSLLEAIASAGGIPSTAAGPDESADLSRSFVLRNGRRLPIDFERLLRHGDLKQNVYLHPDDFVFVAPASQASIYMLGAVSGPGVLPYNSKLTLAAAIVASGGTVKYAQNQKVVVIRGTLTQPHIAEIDYKDIVTGAARDVRLQPGDIVYVPFVPYRFVAELAEQLLDQFVRTIASNEGAYAVSDDAMPAGRSFGGGGASTTTSTQ
jgi:polysaccharide biosynthesis/export protein